MPGRAQHREILAQRCDARTYGKEDLGSFSVAFHDLDIFESRSWPGAYSVKCAATRPWLEMVAQQIQVTTRYPSSSFFDKVQRLRVSVDPKSTRPTNQHASWVPIEE